MIKKIACIFPGQGSQALGMLAELATEYPVIQATFAAASAVLNYDLWQLTQQGPETQLNQTEFTQPALLAAGVAVWRVWQQYQLPEPQLFAGHSLGEYTALVCADAVDFADAIKLVAARGRYMQAAAGDQGAMAAIIGLDEQQVTAICVTAAEQEIVAPANFNAQGQIVIAGHSAAVERAVELAKAQGAKLAKRLAVSVPSHCILMHPAAEQLAVDLAQITITVPRIPVLNNVAVAINNEPAAIKSALIQQLYQPVRWVESVQYLAAQGIDALVECGPGKVLTGLSKRITPAIPTWPLYDMKTLTDCREAFKYG